MKKLQIKVYLQWDGENLYLGTEINRGAMKSRSGKSLGNEEILNLLGNLDIHLE